jgi:hypothetical protein
MREYNIASIETRYNGVIYRSRLEARWAVFFDVIGVRHIYEPGTYNGYLPDFALLNCPAKVIEIKPSQPTFEELDKISQVPAEMSALFAGQPGEGVRVFLFKRGMKYDIPDSRLLALWRQIRGDDLVLAKNMERLQVALGRRDFASAFTVIWRYRFE